MAVSISRPKTGRRFLFQRRYLFHLFFWVMFAVFTLMEMQGYAIRKGFVFLLAPMGINFLLVALLVYGNTLVLIPLLLKRKKTLIYISGIIVLIILYTYFRSLNQQYWDAVIWPEDIMTVQSYFRWNLFYSVWFILISSMLFFTQKWSEQQQKVKNIEINQLQTELKYLRSQLNPHFLFNGLNTIYGNIDIRDQKARDTLLQFSDLLRYSLYEADTDYVELEKEARHLENYVALQKARSSMNIRAALDIHIEDGALKIAPLMFMPFVENAFKFCSRQEDKENYIQIGLQQKDHTIIFRCENTYEEYGPREGGIGLANVRRRLELLYPGKFEMNIHKDHEIYRAELILTI